MTQRREVSDEVILKVVELLVQNVGTRLEKHGRGAFVSPHEALGVLTEEFWELTEAIKSNDPYRIADEWMDNAVTAIFAVASMTAVAAVAPETCNCDATGACTDCSTKTVEAIDAQKVEEAAERARRLMIERAEKSGLVIAETL